MKRLENCINLETLAINLAACPCCGSTSVMFETPQDEAYWRVFCSMCNHVSDWYRRPEFAAFMWKWKGSSPEEILAGYL